MRVVQFRQPGHPADVLSCINQPVPQPAHGEVRVRMLAAPINPSDLMFIRGRYTLQASCPAIPGFEGVGIVEHSGGDLRGRLFQGRRVVVLSRTGGTWAEQTVVPSAQVIPVSRSLSDEQAATFFVNPATAWVMTQEVLRVPQGQWLVQTAAGSALGRMIVRLGQRVGFRSLCVVRRESSAEELRALGADCVVVFNEAEDDPGQLTETLRQIVGESGVGYAVDAVGGRTGSAVIRSLGRGARMLAFGTLSGEPLQFSPRTLMTVGSSVEGFWLGNFLADKGLLFRLGLVRRLTSLIRAGVLDSEIAGSWKPDQVAVAVRAAEDSSINGKCLLRFDTN